MDQYVVQGTKSSHYKMHKATRNKTISYIDILYRYTSYMILGINVAVRGQDWQIKRM